MPTTAAAVIVIKYGNAIHTIRKYERRISGANADVSKKRNAACPFGVAMLGIFVPVLIATACNRLLLLLRSEFVAALLVLGVGLTGSVEIERRA